MFIIILFLIIQFNITISYSARLKFKLAMSDLYEPDNAIAFYRSTDPIKNLKIK